MFTGLVQCFPPSNDFTIWMNPGADVVALKPNWNVNAYTPPFESVRTVHPERPKPFFEWMLFVAELTWVWVQVSPPSREVTTIIGWFVLPLPLPRKSA